MVDPNYSIYEILVKLVEKVDNINKRLSKLETVVLKALYKDDLIIPDIEE